MLCMIKVKLMERLIIAPKGVYKTGRMNRNSDHIADH